MKQPAKSEPVAVPDELYERLFKPRGIDRIIAERRPYVPYSGGKAHAQEGWATVLRWDPKYADELEPEAQRIVRGWIASRPGILINRRPVDGKPVFAEMRPDIPVPTKTTKPHYHADADVTDEDDRWYKHIHGEKDWQHHGDNSRKWTPDGWKPIAESGWHSHRKSAKYTFPPSPKTNMPFPGNPAELDSNGKLVRSPTDVELAKLLHPQWCYDEDGAVLFASADPASKTVPQLPEAEIEPGMMVAFDGDSDMEVITGYLLDVTTGRKFNGVSAERHISRYHQADLQAGVKRGELGPHQHWNQINDYRKPRARRLDVHRDGWAPLRQASRAQSVIFFALEGCLKADALLSAREAVFSCPSVSLWNAPELSLFAQTYLRGCAVVVVPDSDWEDKDEVITQARTAAFFLSHLDDANGKPLRIRAVVAAPTPEPVDCELHGVPAGHKRGVDDYIGDLCAVDDMPVIDRRPPDLENWEGTLNDLLRAKGAKTLYAKGVRNCRTALEWLATNADRDGRVHPATASARIVTGMYPKKLLRTFHDLVNVEAIAVNGKTGDAAHAELKLQRGWWQGGEHRDFDGGMVLRIVKGEHRAITDEDRKVRDLR